MPADPIDPIDGSDRPSTVDESETAGVGTDSPMGPAGQFGSSPGAGARALVDDIIDAPSQDIDLRTTAQQAMDQMGTMESSASGGWAEDQIQKTVRADRQDEYERQLAECEAANAAGEAYYWGDEEHGDVVLSKVTLSDGTTVWITPGSDPPEVVDVEWAADAEFLYQGDYLSGGEAYQVIELPTGHQILVDEHGQSAGLLEDLPPDVLLYPDQRNGGELTEVYVLPAGPPSWDSLVYDAATDELIIRVNTGKAEVSGADLWLLAGSESIDPTQVYSTYNPPGAEYVLVIDSEGNVVDSFVPPPEKVWSVLGIVEYYDDGEVRVDFGPLEVSVDVAGEDGGISITGDVLAFVAPLTEIVPAMEDVGEVSVGVAWEDGDVSMWGEVSGGDLGTFGVTYEAAGLADFVTDAMGGDVDFSTLDGVGAEYRVDAQFGIYGVDGVLGIGINNDGNFFIDADATIEFQLGNMGVEIDTNFYTEIGDTFEVTGGYRGQLDMFGFYLEKGEQFSLVIDDGLLTATYATFIGAGHEQFGGLRVGVEVQVETDGTKDGTSGTGGVYGAVVDKDGEELLRGGIYADTDINGRLGTFTDDEALDTKVTKNTQVFDDEEMPLPSGLLDDTPDEIVPDDVFDDAGGAAGAGDGRRGPAEALRPGSDRAGDAGGQSARADGVSLGGRVPVGDGGRGDGPLGGDRAGNETTIPGSIDPTSPIGAAGGAGGRPGGVGDRSAEADGGPLGDGKPLGDRVPDEVARPLGDRVPDGAGGRDGGPDGGRGDGPFGGGRPGNETTIPGSIDPTSPIGAAGGAGGPGAALSDGPAGPGAGRDRADGVYVQEGPSGIADGRFDQQVPRAPGGPDSVGVSERGGRPGQDRGDETDTGFEPITLERGPVGADRASGAFGDRVDGMSPGDRGAADDGRPGRPVDAFADRPTDGPAAGVVFESSAESDAPSDVSDEGRPDGPTEAWYPTGGGEAVPGRLPGDEAGSRLRGQPDPEERSATDRPTLESVREGVPPMDGGEGDAEDGDLPPVGEGGEDDGGEGDPPHIPLPHDPPDDPPQPDLPPSDEVPPSDDPPPSGEVPFGVEEFDADDITSPRPVGAIGGDAGPLRSPTVDAATGGFGDRLDRPVGGVGPNRDTDDITGPPAGARLPADRPSIGDRPMGATSAQDDSFHAEATLDEFGADDDSFHVEATVELGEPIVEVTVEAELFDDAAGSSDADGFGPDTNGDDDGALGGPQGSDGPGLGDQFDQPGS